MPPLSLSARTMRVWLALACAVAVLGSSSWAAYALLLNHAKPAETLGLPIAVAGLALSLWTLRKPPPAELDAVADDLARRVLLAEQDERLRLVGGTRLLDPACLVSEAAGGPERPETPASLAALLRADPDRRVLITGAPGSGKTVFALGLILTLLRDRPPGHPVPVRFPLAEYDPRHPFTDWLVSRLVADYDLLPQHARTIVDARRVLPVLDGLDEMDSAPGAGAPRPQASLAVRALGRYLKDGTPGPLVVTCRSSELPDADGLEAGVRVRLLPLTPDAVTVFLRLHGSADGGWEPLLTLLRSAPHSPLAAALTTPWRLTLITGAHPRGRDAARLRDFVQDGPGLDAHLLGAFVRAAAEPEPGRTDRYRPDQVRRWLSVLARHLERADGTHSDLRLHELWPLAGRRTVRVVETGAVLGVLGAALLWRRGHPLGGVGSLRHDFLRSLLDIGFLAFVALIVVRVALSRPPAPFGLPLRRTLSPAVLRRTAQVMVPVLFVSIGVAPLVGHGIGHATKAFAEGFHSFGARSLPGLDSRVSMYVVALPVLCVVAALPFALRRAAETDQGSVLPTRTAMRLELLVGLGTGLLVALALGFPYNGYLRIDLTENLGLWLPLAHPMGPVTIGALGLLYGFVFVSATGRRYLSFLLCMTGRLPWRLGRFLAWCQRQGLLRMAGGAYQFRHRELQQWLAQVPDRPSYD